MPKVTAYHVVKVTMKLIGLNIHEMDENLLKVLHPGWYPFGEYERPLKRFDVRQYRRKNFVNVYNIRKYLPIISVSCIVGMNGAGKSTVISILYAIINNFAYKILEGRADSHLAYINGIEVDFYFECDGKVCMLSCNHGEVSYYKEDTQGILKLMAHDGIKLKETLKSFFYTIGINYSIYSQDEVFSSDKVSMKQVGVNTGLYHKNDGYLSPITLVPSRKNGIIDFVNESCLAQQRIIVLSLLSAANKKQFPQGYKPTTLIYSLDEKYIDSKKKYLYELVKKDLQKSQVDRLLDIFQLQWKQFVANKSYVAISNIMLDYSLFYLAYKSIKLCYLYEEYKRLMRLDKERKDTGVAVQALAYGVIQYIQEHKDHLTLKIHQCLKFMQTHSWDIHGEIDVDSLLSNHPNADYEHIVSLLPPPFYDIDIRYIKQKSWKKETEGWGKKQRMMTLSTMSSGEKQILYMVSYVLYHLVNIQSVDENNYRIPYHHVNVVFDEAELYLHPEYQRRFISMLIESLSWTKIDKRKIRSINFLIATHSPFILSDVLRENTLYLKEGEVVKVSNQTFGANYYSMLNGSFFFQRTAIGEIAARKYKRLIQQKNETGDAPLKEELELVGDDFVKAYLNYKDNTHV